MTFPPAWPSPLPPTPPPPTPTSFNSSGAARPTHPRAASGLHLRCWRRLPWARACPGRGPGAAGARGPESGGVRRPPLCRVQGIPRLCSAPGGRRGGWGPSHGRAGLPRGVARVRLRAVATGEAGGGGSRGRGPGPRGGDCSPPPPPPAFQLIPPQPLLCGPGPVSHLLSTGDTETTLIQAPLPLSFKAEMFSSVRVGRC